MIAFVRGVTAARTASETASLAAWWEAVLRRIDCVISVIDEMLAVMNFAVSRCSDVESLRADAESLAQEIGRFRR